LERKLANKSYGVSNQHMKADNFETSRSGFFLSIVNTKKEERF